MLAGAAEDANRGQQCSGASDAALGDAFNTTVA